MDEDTVRAEPFPAPSKRTAGTVNGVSTEVEALSFSDKIIITVSQGGRLAQWVSLLTQ
jgi:proteasome assembly chaperone 3